MVLFYVTCGLHVNYVLNGKKARMASERSVYTYMVGGEALICQEQIEKIIN